MIGVNYRWRTASVNCRPRRDSLTAQHAFKSLTSPCFDQRRRALRVNAQIRRRTSVCFNFWRLVRWTSPGDGGMISWRCDWVTLHLTIQTAEEHKRGFYWTQDGFQTALPPLVHTWDVLKYGCYKAIAGGQRSRQWPTCYCYCKNTVRDDSFPIDVMLNRPRSTERINPLHSSYLTQRCEIQQQFS